MPEATDKAAATDLNAELGQLLGATPAREWRVRMPDGELLWIADEENAKYWAEPMGGEAVLAEFPLCYDASRDLMAGVEEELERRGLGGKYGQRLAEMVCDHQAVPIELTWGYDFFALAHAPPDLRARAARDVLKAAGEK